MEDKIVDLELAKLAGKVGFYNNCEYVYAETIEYEYEDNHTGNEYTHEYVPPRVKTYKYLNSYDRKICLAPSQTELQKWLRETMKINVTVTPDYFPYDFGKITYKVKVWILSEEHGYTEPEFCDFETYEEALEKGLYEAVLDISIRFESKLKYTIN
jgi:hypothetical protein